MLDAQVDPAVRVEVAPVTDADRAAIGAAMETVEQWLDVQKVLQVVRFGGLADFADVEEGIAWMVQHNPETAEMTAAELLRLFDSTAEHKRRLIAKGYQFKNGKVLCPSTGGAPSDFKRDMIRAIYVHLKATERRESGGETFDRIAAELRDLLPGTFGDTRRWEIQRACRYQDLQDRDSAKVAEK